MRSIFFLISLILFTVNPLDAQNPPAFSKIDMMLMQGNYEKVIDTCKQILTYDTLNPEIYYKIGIAYQNLLEDDLSLSAFYHAVTLNPDNKVYNFTLAKGYYMKGKFKLAEPLLSKLCSIDSMKWTYAYYLTGIYMQADRFDDAINIYKKFLQKDSANYVYLDKMGFAYLNKGDFLYATDLYNKSLSINSKNLTAIKNLSYLYASSMRSDTAIQLLSRGIDIDSTDMDLFVRRAQLYYSKSYTKRALDDYLVILASGDSSKLYLKRAGIGYSYNLQPKQAITYLLKAYKADSVDYETCSFLGQSYYKLKDMNNSVYYYNRAVKILTPVFVQLGLTYVLFGESQFRGGKYQDAIATYLKAQNIQPDPANYMKIANIYDEKLNDRENAINYYQKFLDNLKYARTTFTSQYIESIKKRLDFLRKNPPGKEKPEPPSEV